MAGKASRICVSWGKRDDQGGETCAIVRIQTRGMHGKLRFIYI